MHFETDNYTVNFKTKLKLQINKKVIEDNMT